MVSFGLHRFFYTTSRYSTDGRADPGNGTGWAGPKPGGTGPDSHGSGGRPGDHLCANRQRLQRPTGDAARVITAETPGQVNCAALASAPAPPARNFSDILDVANILSRLPLSPAGVIAIITTLPIGD